MSQWGKAPKPTTFKFDPTVDMSTDPLGQVNSMSATKFFAYGAELMMNQPSHLTDWSQLERMKRIGFESGKSYDLAEASPAVRAALERVPSDTIKVIKTKFETLARVVNGWQMNTDSMGVWGDYYLKRAVIAMTGLGANQPEDAVYPQGLTDADGKPLQGGKRYLLHFGKSEMPPAGAFWSVTTYDGDGFPTFNSLERYSIGDRDALVYNSDGSLDIYIQPENPGKDKEANWLPSAKSGPIAITMRLYAPKPQALDGRWAPPAIRHVQQKTCKR